MKRFLLSAAAVSDMDHIKAYLDSLPVRPSARIAQTLFYTLRSITASSAPGVLESDLSERFGQPVRSRLAGAYRIFYDPPSASQPLVEVIAIRHGARDPAAILPHPFN